MSSFFFFNDTATTEIYTLSLHDALPISYAQRDIADWSSQLILGDTYTGGDLMDSTSFRGIRLNSDDRSEEHTSELQSRQYLVCRLLLEKKKKNHHIL